MICTNQDDLSFSVEGRKKRFLREGVLDEMIRQLHVWDRDSFKHESPLPTLASLIQMFEASRLALKRLEALIEIVRQENPDCARDLIYIAYILQTGLRNAFIGVEDEKVNISN